MSADRETTDAPEVGDYVELTFTGEHGGQSPITGRVTEVDTDCEDIPETDLMFVVDNGESNKQIHYAEGDTGGERQATVTRYSDFSGSHRLGENAEWTLLK